MIRRILWVALALSNEATHDLPGGGDHDDPRFVKCEIRPIPLVPR